MATALTAADLKRELREETGLTTDDVNTIFEVIEDVVLGALKKARAGDRVVVLPGVVGIYKKHYPAKRARRGINPFTQEEQMFKAKPAHNKVKSVIYKKAKDVV